MIIDKGHVEILLNKYGVLFFPRITSTTEVGGDGATFERYTQHFSEGFMPLGAYSYSLSFFGHISKIGRYCSIGRNVTVMGDKHPTAWPSTSPVFYRKGRARNWGSKRIDFPEFDAHGPKVTICNDVWVGDNVTLAHGVQLGTGCIVAAHSVVTKDVPPYTIVAGVPARIIRKRFDDATTADLIASQWWSLPVSAWDEIDPTSTSDLLKKVDEIRATEPELPEERFSIGRLMRNKFML
ncbi:acetyltransferase-like isoleucine patch superfamily enzyme [Sulfitobacter undariae]|uniref:Acetyltransferase-like isoleucine patch superfamily enzyme n=1 Tax=Sulfitobacter undariae TaxID=1563671 RepID=A0A7W6H1E5_9RHOB|nr:CatB-related O-acetyltransferase [Sulfitobacter undariae]MBB3993679.1 acetyltransferase-like isoleucine patch superfamily enzyme [Sulfitobacter undariae]